VITDPDTIAAFRLDRSGWDPGGQPLGVIQAESVAQVQETLRQANSDRIPVVVRGAGTGLAGAATAADGELVLDLSKLNRIREISPLDAVAVVEPGVITANVNRAAVQYGLRYAPDPASLEISTIGGNIATNAGGLLCAKYGVTRDWVLGLDVVLADGELISTGGRTRKGVTGYDLTSLFVGSEGTLGVIVGATLRLEPVPAATATVAAYFADVEQAADAAARLPALAAVVELIDPATMRAIDGTSEAFLLVQTDGGAAHAEADAVQEALSSTATRVLRARDSGEAERLVGIRRQALPALERIGRPLIEDIVVPRSRLAEAMRRLSRIGTETGVPIFTFAHAADGNLHPIIVIDRNTVGIPDEAWHAAEQVFALALELGGRLTGEHGVGVLKRRFVGTELGARSHRVQQQLRELFDPHAILNPGKAL
jgi:glycolate oxidase